MRNGSNCCKINLPNWNVEASFQDILSRRAALLTCLNIRETSELYANIRNGGRDGMGEADKEIVKIMMNV